jgi:hypothetical protein
MVDDIDFRLSKVLCVTFTALGSYLGAMFSFCIIWYELNGSDMEKTLISRLFTIGWVCPLAWMSVILQVDIFRYVFGPLPKLICLLNVYLKFFVTMFGIILLDFIVLARYVFIFVLKNPAAFNDLFWSQMIFLWTLLFTAISQFVLLFLDGKDFPDIWIGTGTNPNLDPETNYKSVFGNNVIKVFTYIIHVYIVARIKIYTWKFEKRNSSTPSSSKMFWMLRTEAKSFTEVAESVTPGVNFINILKSTFSCKSVLHSFFLVTVWLL